MTLSASSARTATDQAGDGPAGRHAAGQAEYPVSRAAPDGRVLDSIATDDLLALMHGGPVNPGFSDDGSPSPRYRHFLDALGVAVYTADSNGRITYYNDAAASLWGRRPALGEEWCGSWRLYWSDGRAMRHDECPMAVAIREERVVRGLEAMAEREDGSRVSFVPYPTPLHDADGRLIGAVNVMVDVTERRRAEEALRSTAEALSASSAVKDEFLGLVSHELRTPVTTIFGNARLLRDRGHSLPDRAKEAMVADIADDAERLLGIVENLLLLTRLGSGATADLEPQILEHEVRRVVRSYRARHPQRRIVLRSQPEQLIVEADRAYLDVLLENLISNADKYSPRGAVVEVIVQRSADFARVVVRDRGIGLDDGEIQNLFTPFYRGHHARAIGNGVGIGLTVSRRLVESLGGHMWARPRAGGGSEFGFALPLASDH